MGMANAPGEADSAAGDGRHPALLVVLGASASGKTSIARQLAGDLRLPLYAKDDLKERLFDQLGTRDEEWSHRLGRACFVLLHSLAETELAVGRSVAIEGNFRPDLTNDGIRRILDAHGARLVQVYCHAPADELVRRYAERANSGQRHPGHGDSEHLDEVTATIRQTRWAPLDLPGTVVDVDTTNPNAVDYPAILARVRAAVEG